MWAEDTWSNRTGEGINKHSFWCVPCSWECSEERERDTGLFSVMSVIFRQLMQDKEMSDRNRIQVNGDSRLGKEIEWNVYVILTKWRKKIKEWRCYVGNDSFCGNRRKLETILRNKKKAI